MGGHIVWPFAGVLHPGHGRVVRGRYETPEKFAHIPAHIRIGIFRDQQRARGVADKQGEQAAIHALGTNISVHIGRKLIKSGPDCRYFKYFTHRV